MQRKFFILLAVVVALSFSCQQELDIEQPLILYPKILSVEPNSAKPGDVITITVENFKRPSINCNWWIGNGQVCIDSGTASKLFARVPWGISNGILFYKTQTDTIVGPPLSITSTCSSDVCLSSYTGTPIADSSSWVVGSTGIINKWSASISGDTVALTQYYGYGDDSGIRKTIRFIHRGNTILPLYANGTWANVEIQYTRAQPLAGYIAIDRWSIPGVLSGRVSTYLMHGFYGIPSWEDFNFYAVVQ